jgi:hypothetical protein
MIAMKFTIEPDIGLSFLLQAALPQLVTDRETKTHRRGRAKRSYGHCRRRTEIPEAGPPADGTEALAGAPAIGADRASRKTRPVKVPAQIPHTGQHGPAAVAPLIKIRARRRTDPV